MDKGESRTEPHRSRMFMVFLPSPRPRIFLFLPLSLPPSYSCPSIGAAVRLSTPRLACLRPRATRTYVCTRRMHARTHARETPIFTFRTRYEPPRLEPTDYPQTILSVISDRPNASFATELSSDDIVRSVWVTLLRRVTDTDTQDVRTMHECFMEMFTIERNGSWKLDAFIIVMFKIERFVKVNTDARFWSQCYFVKRHSQATRSMPLSVVRVFTTVFRRTLPVL